MKNNMIKYLACSAMALGLAATVQAATITGGISLAGGPLGVNTGDLATGTAVTSFGSVGVTSVSGSYAGLIVAPGAGTPTVYTAGFTFLPSPGLPTGPVQIWAFFNSGTLYDFVLSNVQTVSQGIYPNGIHFLDVSGMGTLDIGGDSVLGSYDLKASSDNTSTTFSFSSSNGAQVPDGGMTALLLGAALSALGLIRRKLA